MGGGAGGAGIGEVLLVLVGAVVGVVLVGGGVWEVRAPASVPRDSAGAAGWGVFGLVVVGSVWGWRGAGMAAAADEVDDGDEEDDEGDGAADCDAGYRACG